MTLFRIGGEDVPVATVAIKTSPVWNFPCCIYCDLLRQWRYRLVAASGVDEEGDDETVWATFISLWLHLFYSATPRYGISLDCSRRILSHRFLVSFDKSVEIVILFHIISLVNVKWLRPCWCCSHLQFPRSFNKMSPLSYSCTDFTASFLNWQCLEEMGVEFSCISYLLDLKSCWHIWHGCAQTCYQHFRALHHLTVNLDSNTMCHGIFCKTFIPATTWY